MRWLEQNSLQDKLGEIRFLEETSYWLTPAWKMSLECLFPFRCRHGFAESLLEELHNAEAMPFGCYQRVELLIHGNLQPWRQTKAFSAMTLPSFEITCLGPVGHQVSALVFSAIAFN